MAYTRSMKRRASAFPRWGAKRRRTAYKRRGYRRGGRKTISWTSQTGALQGIQFKSRKLSKRAWRRKLWNDTLAVQHFRSSGVGTATLTSSTALGDGSVTIINPTFIGAPSAATAFWTVAGGLQLTDEGGTAVTFDETDLVIRGGRIGITITCPDTITEELGVTINVVRVFSNPDYGLVPAIITYGSNLDSGPDFSRRFGRVLYKKTAILSNTYSSMTVEHRLRVEKIDQETFGTVLGGQVIFVVVITPLQTSPAVGYDLPTLTYHDMSFTGDTV